MFEYLKCAGGGGGKEVAVVVWFPRLLKISLNKKRKKKKKTTETESADFLPLKESKRPFRKIRATAARVYRGGRISGRHFNILP